MEPPTRCAVSIYVHDVASTSLSSAPFVAGYVDGPLASARYDQPSGLALDAQSDRLFVADNRNHAVRAVDLTRHMVTTTIRGSTRGPDGCPSSATFTIRAASASPQDRSSSSTSRASCASISQPGAPTVWSERPAPSASGKARCRRRSTDRPPPSSSGESSSSSTRPRTPSCERSCRPPERRISREAGRGSGRRECSRLQRAAHHPAKRDLRSAYVAPLARSGARGRRTTDRP